MTWQKSPGGPGANPASHDLTAVPLQPTGPPTEWVHLDSNQGPAGYEPDALTAELWTREAAPATGFWSIPKGMAPPGEPIRPAGPPPATHRTTWIGGAYVLLLGVGLWRHEMWRDELQAWAIAGASPSLGALLDNLRYEGHPGLWHLLLWPLAHATRWPGAMQAVHFACAAAGAALFLRWAPLPRLLGALFLLGYLPLFEYGVVSRNYALALPALWALCRLWTASPRPWLTLGACLALLANANPYAWLLAAAAAGALAVEEIAGWARRRTRRGPAADAAAAPAATAAAAPRGWAAAGGAALALLGLLVALWQMVPPPDALYAGGFRAWSVGRLYRAAGTVLAGYVPVPDFATVTPWNSALVFRLAPPLLALLAAAWLVAAWLLLAEGAARRFFALGSAALLAFTYVCYIGWARHHGHHLLLFVACCWLALARLPPAAAARRWIPRVLAGLPAVGYPDPVLTAVGAYRGAPLRSLGSGRPVDFVRWRVGGEASLEPRQLCARLAEATRRAGGTIAFVAPTTVLPAACPAVTAERIGPLPPLPLVPSERLVTWRVALRR